MTDDIVRDYLNMQEWKYASMQEHQGEFPIGSYLKVNKTVVVFVVLVRGNFFILSESLSIWLYFEPRLKIIGCTTHGLKWP